MQPSICTHTHLQLTPEKVCCRAAILKPKCKQACLQRSWQVSRKRCNPAGEQRLRAQLVRLNVHHATARHLRCVARVALLRPHIHTLSAPSRVAHLDNLSCVHLSLIKSASYRARKRVGPVTRISSSAAYGASDA
eukprot:349632-Chlamydomonas_euryale.AAC.23